MKNDQSIDTTALKSAAIRFYTGAENKDDNSIIEVHLYDRTNSPVVGWKFGWGDKLEPYTSKDYWIPLNQAFYPKRLIREFFSFSVTFEITLWTKGSDFWTFIPAIAITFEDNTVNYYMPILGDNVWISAGDQLPANQKVYCPQKILSESEKWVDLNI